MNVTRTAAALAAAAVFVLAGCATADQLGAAPAAPPILPTELAALPTTPPSTPEPGPRITDVAQLNPVCPLLDAGQVGAWFGGTPASGIEGQMSRLENGAEATQCTYVAGDSPVAVLTVSVGRGSTIAPDVMISAIQQQSGNGEPVSGVGAAALYYTQGEATVLTSANTVGGTPVLVSISGPSTTPRDAYRTVLTSLVSRF